MVPYLFLDYVPWQSRDARPALLVWFERQPQLFGLGVVPGCPFDVRPFAGTYSADVEAAWVFAEWVEAIRAELQLITTRDALLAWLAGIPESPFRIGEMAEAEQPAPLLERIAAPPIQTRQVAISVLCYLAKEVSPVGLEATIEQVAAGAKRRAVLSLRADDELVAQCWLTRQTSSGRWWVQGAEVGAPRLRELGDLEAESFPQTLGTWLADCARLHRR